MIKPIVFVDYYQTLTADSYWRLLDDSVQGDVESYLYEAGFDMFVAWMCGEYTDEEIHRKLAKELGYDFQELWDGFVEGARTVSIDSDAKAFLHKYSLDIPLILATDNFNCFDEFVVPNTPVLSCFDGIYNSYNLRKTKLENCELFFNKIANEENNDLSSSYLLEDNSDICKSFELVGKRAIHIDDPKQTASALENLVQHDLQKVD